MNTKHLGLLRSVLGPSGANFGIVFPILVRWAFFSPNQRIGKTAVSTQRSATASRGCHGLACVAMYAVVTSPRPGFPNPKLEIRRKSQAQSPRLGNRRSSCELSASSPIGNRPPFALSSSFVKQVPKKPGRIAHPLYSPAAYLVCARKTVTWRVAQIAKSL